VGTAQLLAPAGDGGGAAVTVCIRAAEVELTLPDQASAPQANRLPGSVRAIRADGSIWRVELDCGFRLTTLVAAPAARRLGLAVGQPIVAQIETAAVHLIPRPSGPG
jgi:ABC-type molybdate transport system ATPase subunit